MIRLSKIRCHSLVIFIASSLSNVQQNNFSKLSGRACPESSKVEGNQKTPFCLSDRREKFFLAPSLLLRMAGVSPPLGSLRVFTRGFFLRARRVLRGDTCFSFQVCGFV